MFGGFFTKAADPVAIPQEVAQFLAEIEARSSYFSTVEIMRDYVLEKASTLSAEHLHQVTDHLTRKALKENSNNIKSLFSEPTLTRSLLAYEFVHSKELAAGHLRDGGAILSALGYVQYGLVASGKIYIPPTMPEIAFFLLGKTGDAETLNSARADDGTAKAKYLNAIDAFIIKYFIAELDETRKQQEDRRMNDERGGYRGGRKVSVGLAVKNAIIADADNMENIAQVFLNALEENGITYDDFFDGSTKAYLRDQISKDKTLYYILKNATATATPSPR